MTLLIKTIKYWLLLLTIAGFIPLFFPRCANIVPPTGGPRDTIPPEVIRSTPSNFTTNFTRSGIHIEFDEFIELRNINQQFLMTPPQSQRPEFRARGRDLYIELKDDLIANTTYTLNFGDAIVDLNEGNALSNFEFVFSTGDVIDSLSYSGTVLNAFDNEPVEGAIVMLYNELHDSVPYRQMPLYANRTGKDGRFRLNNLRGDTFLVFVITDVNNNYLYDRPGEELIAFRDDYILPDTIHIHGHPHDHHHDHDHHEHDHHHDHDHHEHDHHHQHNGDHHHDHSSHDHDHGHHHHDHQHIIKVDTLPSHLNNHSHPREPAAETGDTIRPGQYGWHENDSVVLADTIELKPEINFPEGDTLFLFREETGRQFVSRNERNQRGELLFVFNLPLSREWSIEPLNFEPAADWMVEERNSRKDSIRYWITDPVALEIDNMRFLATYWATGPSDSLQKISDTLNMNFATPRTRRAGQSEDAPVALSANFSIRRDGNQELNKDLVITFPEPLSDIDQSKVRLASAQNNETALHNFDLIRDSLKIRNYHLKTAWAPGRNYRLSADPGAFTGIYGHVSDSINFTFTTREEDHYGRILVTVTGVAGPVIIQLLGENKNVLSESHLRDDDEVIFDYLQPQKFFLKAIFDTNDNGKWDTGNYLKGIQPERVMLYREVIATRSNWDIEISWDLR
jgi:hypothetical protein